MKNKSLRSLYKKRLETLPEHLRKEIILEDFKFFDVGAKGNRYKAVVREK